MTDNRAAAPMTHGTQAPETKVSEKAQTLLTAAIDAAINRGRVMNASDFNPDRAKARREQEGTEDALLSYIGAEEKDAKIGRLARAMMKNHAIGGHSQHYFHDADWAAFREAIDAAEESR